MTSRAFSKILAANRGDNGCAADDAAKPERRARAGEIAAVELLHV